MRHPEKQLRQSCPVRKRDRPLQKFDGAALKARRGNEFGKFLPGR